MLQNQQLKVVPCFLFYTRKDFVSWFGVDEKISQVQEEVIGDEEEILSSNWNTKGNEAVTHPTAWVILENITLSERSQI